MQEGRAVSLVLDISISMGKPHGDLVPTKLEAVVESVLVFARRMLEKGASIGVVVFFENAVPIAYPTRSYNDLLDALSSINRTYEGSSLGDGILWGVRILRRTQGRRALVAITDGEVTGGVPLSLALAYAKNSRVDTRILLIGRETIEGAPREMLRVIHSKADLMRALGELAE